MPRARTFFSVATRYRSLLILHSLDKKRSKPKKPKQDNKVCPALLGIGDEDNSKNKERNGGCCHKDYLSSLWRVLCRSTLNTSKSLWSIFCGRAYVSAIYLVVDNFLQNA